MIDEMYWMRCDRKLETNMKHKTLSIQEEIYKSYTCTYTNEKTQFHFIWKSKEAAKTIIFPGIKFIAELVQLPEESAGDRAISEWKQMHKILRISFCLACITIFQRWFDSWPISIIAYR